MKIAIASDLHIERPGGAIKLGGEGDVLILAGDIVPAKGLPYWYIDIFNDMIEEAEANFDHVIMVMGNHEHYEYNFTQTLSHLRSHLGKTIVLEKESVVIDDVTFLGGTLWTDMRMNYPVSLLLAKRIMPDYWYIRNDSRMLIPDDTVDDHYLMKAFLEQSLPESKSVVVTHHAPSTLSIHDKYKDDVATNTYFVSDLFDFIYDRPQIKLWVHGHTHSPFDYMINETRIVCNPRGYIDREPEAASFQLKYVEV